jgi:hypothetical protein
MLTIFCTAKPFLGHFKVIQENALRSWRSLQPQPEILLMGDGPGYSEAAQSLGLRQIKRVTCNERGLPLISSMFETAQLTASNNILCYLDADIILTHDFIPAVEVVAGRFDRFMMVGPSAVAEVRQPLDFSSAGWTAEVLTAAAGLRRTHGSWWGMDYFVFPRGTFPTLPPFVVGRPGWDNWLVYHARSRKLPVVDASAAVTAIHQDHDYSNHPLGHDEVWRGADALANDALVGGGRRLFSVCDATHLLTRRGVRRARTPRHIWRRIYTLPVLHPRLTFLGSLLDAALAATRPLRLRMGLTLSRM